jgi:transcriptional regulator with XRE-family HTH domain
MYNTISSQPTQQNNTMQTTETPAQAIAERLRGYFNEKELTTYRVSQMIGLGKSTKLNKILSGNAAPSTETLLEIASVFPELSLDWLLLGRQSQTLAPVAMPDEPEKPLPFHAVTSGRVLAVTVDRTGNENILHIPSQSQAGYPHSHDEPAYLRDLMTYTLPLFTTGSFRSFEVEGDSMKGTFGHHDIVLCQFVDRWDLLEPGHCYVVVLTDKVVAKRLLAPIRNRRDMVDLVSDNRAYPVHSVPASDIVEIWHVRAILSTNIPASGREMQDRMLELLEALGVDQRETRRVLETMAPKHAPSA